MGTVMRAATVTITSGIPSLHYSTRAWVAVAEQGLVATASTTVLWNWGLKRVPASQAGIFVNLEPLVGAILGVSVLREVLGNMALAGGALIIGEPFISVTNQKKRLAHNSLRVPVRMRRPLATNGRRVRFPRC